MRMYSNYIFYQKMIVLKIKFIFVIYIAVILYNIVIKIIVCKFYI